MTKKSSTRSKAGRKPVKDKKRGISIYVKESTIKRLGIEFVRELATGTVERYI
jgi:hypothetical protein